MAFIKGVGIGEVVAQGPGLVFVVYPKAISLMPLAPFWAVLFFLLLLLVGIDSQFCNVEAVVAAITDVFPNSIGKTRFRRSAFVAFNCIICGCIGLFMVTYGGMYVFQIISNSGYRNVMLIAAIECLGIGWIYGADRFIRNMEMMWSKPLGKVSKFLIHATWKIACPICSIGLFVLNYYYFGEDLSYERHGEMYHYPLWTVVIGKILAYCSLSLIPLVMILELVKSKNGASLRERFVNLIKPIYKPHMVHPDDTPDSYILEDRHPLEQPLKDLELNEQNVDNEH